MNEFLRRARAVFDDPACPLAHAARSASLGLFSSGGVWMQQALEYLRGSPLPGSRSSLNRVGFLKYGLATGAALLTAVPIILIQVWPLLVLCVPVFYAVEAQMVFLFPLLLDGGDSASRVAGRPAPAGPWP
jgi:hypothetical protein